MRASKDTVRDVLCGPVIPLVTHYNSDLSLDFGAISANVEYLIEAGVRTGDGCLLAAAAGGDFPMLSLAERKSVLELVARVAAGRVPIVAGAQATDPRETLQIVRAAEDLGLYAVQVSPPYYYAPSDEDVLRHFRAVDRALIDCGLMIYNTYWHGYNFPLPVLDEVAALDHAVALKWAVPSGGIEHAAGVLRYAARLAVVDNAYLWPLTFLMGGTGFITHLASVCPEIDLGTWRMLKAGRYQDAAGEMARRVFPWVERQAEMGKRTSGEAPIVRCGLELCGRPGGPSRPPSRELDSVERAELADLLTAIGAPVATAAGRTS